MDNLGATVANKVLDHINGVATFTVTPPLKLALSQSVPDDETPVAEPEGGSYARKTVTLTAAADRQSTNTATLVFAQMPACFIAGFAIYDSAPTPQLVWQGAATSVREVVEGDDFEVPAGALVVSLG